MNNAVQQMSLMLMLMHETNLKILAEAKRVTLEQRELSHHATSFARSL